MDPILWAYGLMARETGEERGPRDPARLGHYREALGLSLVETESLASAGWSESRVPTCSMRDRMDILRNLAVAAREVPGGWAEERQRLVRLAERFSIPPIECANILVAASEGQQRERDSSRWDRRSLLFAGGAIAGGALAVYAGVRFFAHRAQAERFAGFEERFADTLLLIEVECDLILGTGRVPHRSLGMGFFVSSDGLIVTNKHVVQPWKFVAELVRKLDAGYVLDQESIRLRAWRQADLRLGERGRFDDSTAFQTDKGTLAIVQITPDQMTNRAVALAEGGVHRGEYHVLDRSNVVLLQAKVARPVHAIPLAGAAPEGSQPVMALGLSLPRRSERETRVRVRSSLGRVSPGHGGTLRLSASVPPQCSGGPILDLEGRALGVATHRLGDAEGARCVPADAVRDLIGLGE